MADIKLTAEAYSTASLSIKRARQDAFATTNFHLYTLSHRMNIANALRAERSREPGRGPQSLRQTIVSDPILGPIPPQPTGAFTGTINLTGPSATAPGTAFLRDTSNLEFPLTYILHHLSWLYAYDMEARETLTGCLTAGMSIPLHLYNQLKCVRSSVMGSLRLDPKINEIKHLEWLKLNNLENTIWDVRVLRSLNGTREVINLFTMILSSEANYIAKKELTSSDSFPLNAGYQTTQTAITTDAPLVEIVDHVTKPMMNHSYGVNINSAHVTIASLLNQEHVSQSSGLFLIPSADAVEITVSYTSSGRWGIIADLLIGNVSNPKGKNISKPEKEEKLPLGEAPSTEDGWVKKKRDTSSKALITIEGPNNLRITIGLGQLGYFLRKQAPRANLRRPNRRDTLST